MSISNNMEFSTYDHDNTGCVALSKVANWHIGIGRVCSSQSVNGVYKGKYIKPSQYKDVMYWSYDTPLRTIQLMVRPVA